MSTPLPPLPADVVDALRRGDQIEAIKRLREATGLGLTEAKQRIDREVSGNPAPIGADAAHAGFPPAVEQALRRGDKIEAIEQLRKHTGLGLKEAKDAIDASPLATRERGLAPGEVPRSGGVLKWVVMAVAAGVVAWMVFRHVA